VVGRRGENFGVEKTWKKYIYASMEDGIFVHPENSINGLIRKWCIGGYWFIPALYFRLPAGIQYTILAFCFGLFYWNSNF
jgi:hypothetical protein